MAWKSAFRLGLVALSISAAVGVPLAASASAHSDAPYARSAAAAGVTFGGLTAQGWPVVIQFNKSQRRVVRAVIGLELRCTSGGFANMPDGFVNLRVNTRRKFRASFGPITQRYDDGSTYDLEGSISGALNRARSKVSGKWHLKVTDHDSAGAVTDTCDSGSVRWTAKQ
jgi:hypothetical protein